MARCFAAALAGAALVAYAGAAQADLPTSALSGLSDDDAFFEGPSIPRAPSISDQIEASLTQLGSVIDAHLGALTLDAMGLRIDGAHRRARMQVGAGSRLVSLHLDSRVRLERGLARVAARIDLGVAGRTWHLELPEIEVVPSSYGGERYVELRLPLLEGTF